MKKFITDWAEVPVIIDLPYVACIVGQSPENLKRLAAAGKFPATKVGKEWRVEKDQLRLYLTQNRVLNMAPDTAV